MKRSRRMLQKGAVTVLAASAGLTAWFAQAANVDHDKVKDPTDKNLWSRKPIESPVLPKVKGQTRNAVDNFVLAKLEEKGLTLSPEADKVTLIRRLAFA